ncbi:MAG: amino acid adenylation domain-containing protein, partial [Cyclobacteriaceae bacterium]
MSDSQRRLWSLSQFEESSVAYNLPGHTFLDQSINVENFERAINSTVDRHEILRTVFRRDDSGEVRQWILDRKALGFNITYEDFSKDADSDERAKSYIDTDAFKPFDLEKGPLLRAALLQVDEGKYIFYYNMHHVISDGWSLSVLTKDVLSFYEAYERGETPELAPLRIQYKDYSAWQLSSLEDGGFDHHRKYWKELLQGDLPLLDLPLSSQRPKIKTSNGRSLQAYIKSDLTAKLRNYSESHGGSLYMSMLAGWNILMYHYTRQRDIVIGSSVAGRGHYDLEEQIGFYSNTLALRNRIEPEESFNEFFARLKDATLASFSHQAYPFIRLVEDLDLRVDPGRNAIFDVMLFLQNNGDKVGMEDLAEEQLNKITDMGYQPSKFDVNVGLREVNDCISLNLIYNPDLYEKEMIEGLIRHYQQLLNALVEHPDSKISELSYLSEEEKSGLLTTPIPQGRNYPTDKTIVELFARQVAETPERTAVVHGDTKLSYRALDKLSNRLAHYLIDSYSIKPDDLVGIMLNRSEWSVISLLGIMKSGGAYVPVEPEDPSSRKDFILNDASLKVLITEVNFIHDIGFYEGEIFAIDVEFEPESHSDSSPVLSSGPKNLAYVIYTSGSTGKPKGAMITQSALVDYTYGILERTNMADCATFGLVSTLSADLGNTVIYPSLLTGGSLHVIAKEDILDVEQMRSMNLECLKMTPSHWKSLQTEDRPFAPNKCLLLGGEPFSEDILNSVRLIESTCEVYNHYGPTEATIGKLVKHVDRSNESGKVSLGTPIGDNQVYILNEFHQLVPVGVGGEICISGAGLADGYLNSPELTSEKFVDNPFQTGALLYKTGDLGRKLPNGEIEFLGRIDEQVKIRGYRIELGEIELSLQNLEEIEDGVVIAYANQNDEKELVAYIVTEATLNASVLRSSLRKHLPEYMLPSSYVVLTSIPLTPNGKVDRASLPDPRGLELPGGDEYIAPRNEIEVKLESIWKKILQLDRTGVEDNFFVLGGDSLNMIKLSNEYWKELSVKLPLKDFFEHTTIASQAELIKSQNNADFVKIEEVPLQENYAISDAQRRLWVLSQFEQNGAEAYNIPRNISLSKEINIANFVKAIEATIDRHEILRTVFKENESGEIRQWIISREELDFKIDFFDYGKKTGQKELVQTYIKEDGYKTFDFEKGPLIRAALFRMENDDYIFYYNMHHIISDGWSTEVLTADLLKFYEAYQSDSIPPLKELRIQYKDYSAWQLAQLKEKSFEDHKSYWLNSLSGELPILDLPTSTTRPVIKTNNGYSLATYIDKSTLTSLKNYSHNNGGSLFIGLLASWNVLMNSYTSQNDIIIGTPVAGRDHADLEDQIGFYVNTLPLRNVIDPESSFNDVYKQIKNNTLESYSHQMYPFDRLVEDLNLKRDTSRSAICDVMITLQNRDEYFDGSDISEKDLNTIAEIGNIASKIDISVTFEEIGEYLSVQIIYNQDVYEIELISGLLRNYKNLLLRILNNPEQKINRFEYLSEEEKNRLLSFNGRTIDYQKDKTVIDLFEEQVRESPNSIAVRTDNISLTYQELDDISNQLAHYLIDKYTIQPDDLIEIKLERNEWIIISIIGILKSGAAYIPVDNSNPEERIEFIETDANCKVCIDADELEVFNTDRKEYSTERIQSDFIAGQLAYVIYTSGSTGKPKGVMVEHSGLVNMAYDHIRKFELTRADNILQFVSFSFDGSVIDIFMSLLSGATLVILDRNIVSDKAAFLSFVNRHEVSVMT